MEGSRGVGEDGRGGGGGFFIGEVAFCHKLFCIMNPPQPGKYKKEIKIMHVIHILSVIMLHFAIYLRIIEIDCSLLLFMKAPVSIVIYVCFAKLFCKKPHLLPRLRKTNCFRDLVVFFSFFFLK